jgi:xanthine dehydrogenase accessory factor
VPKEIELWRFIGDRLKRGESVILLVVAESHGSSPGRAGYKMAVAENGDLIGSIGGGVMEVNLVEQARAILSEPRHIGTNSTALIEQEHRKNSDHPSGMICSGRQTILQRVLSSSDLPHVTAAFNALANSADAWITLSKNSFAVGQAEARTLNTSFNRHSESEFTYIEKLGPKNQLVIIGGGHCALALSELMSRMDFTIKIFDDRPELNTLEKNEFAYEITIIDGYDKMADHVASGENIYIVVMTLGYKTDEIVIRHLLGKQFKYFGVLGSRAKMATLLRELKSEGYPQDQLDAIRTPIGIPINSHTPEEIAVSIAAEIISVKNA